MNYYVYITTNRNHTTLYTGVTSDLQKRMAEHKLKVKAGFTKQYHVDQLVYYEVFENAISAITREKQLKGGSRQKKLNLVLKMNRKWEDLTTKL